MGIHHDRLYKELLQTFFEEFMELFFPDISPFIDYSHVKFLSGELDLARGTAKRADVLIETSLIEGDAAGKEMKKKRTLIVVHLEPRSYYPFTFPERMFLYSGKLYEKYRRRILPIAVFSRRRPQDEPTEFSWSLPFLDVLRFRYLTVQLKNRNWRSFLDRNNPVAAALLSSMDYHKSERVQVKLEFLRMITRMKLDPARIKLLAVFFESYLKLTKDEEDELEMNLDRQHLKEESELMEWMTSWEIKGMKKGLKEGREEGLKEGIEKGKIEGKQEVALKMLEKGMDPKTIREVTGLSPRRIARLRDSLAERLEEPSPYGQA